MRNKTLTTASWFGALYGFIFLMLIGNISLMYFLQKDQQADAAIVDGAGRNRMLSQKIAFLSLRAYEGENVSNELTNTIDLHDASFYALKDGGIISGIDEVGKIDESPASLLPLFAQAEESWILFRDKARIIAAKSIVGTVNTDADSIAAVAYVKERAAEILERNNAIVEAYVGENARKQTILVYAFILLFIFDIVVVLAAYLLSRRLTKSLREEVLLKEESLQKLSGTTKSLDMKTETLEKQRVAMLNVMEDLQGEKARTEAILAGVGEGLFVTDAEQRVLFVNDAFEKMLGYSESELAGKVLSDIIVLAKADGKELSKNDRPLYRAISTRKVIEVSSIESLMYKKKDGTFLAVSMTVSPIIVNNQFIGAVEVFRDVTQEREVDKAKTEFVSLASHQLKTPIGAIQWDLEMLSSGDYGSITDPQREVLNEAYLMSKRMNDLVNALLNISRIEMGVFIIEPKLTDFASLCDEVIKEMEPRRLQKYHELTRDFDQKLPLVPADDKLLRVIFQNFISNAIKYTQDKGKITVSLKADDRNIVFSVANNGESIPERDQPRIFTKMFRASNAQDQDPDGNGLGLYVVKEIVEKVGGKLWFTSKKGEDTVFTCSFPLSGMVAKSGTKKIS